ncbi:MAG: hypothetical protein WAO83_02990 [Fuerstiella sp.]
MTGLKQLEALVREDRVSPGERQRRVSMIAEHVFATSPYLNEPNFSRFHPDDLQLLYELYDETFFKGLLHRSLNPKQISFRLSKRMTSAGGKTTRWIYPQPNVLPKYEIAISTPLMFQSFNAPEENVVVTGLECDSRLDGLMRIMEHEIVHLIEMLVWLDSSCSLHRFQNIASRLFGHTDHRHELMTPSVLADQKYGIRTGSRVRFHFEGQRFEGIVNRVTKRATVLVAHPKGMRYSDGIHYLKFYMPLSALERVG